MEDKGYFTKVCLLTYLSADFALSEELFSSSFCREEGKDLHKGKFMSCFLAHKRRAIKIKGG